MNKKKESFKSDDNFIIKLINKTYIDISNYLNNKYINRAIHKRWLESRLEDKFIIEYNRDNPDYLIFNIFGNEHNNPKYKNAIKIGVLTENIIPNLNEVDYALGHAHISYLDRYFKSSIFIWNNFAVIKEIREEVLKNPIRTKFCAAVISMVIGLILELDF